jgi:hypothetical protein
MSFLSKIKAVIMVKIDKLSHKIYITPSEIKIAELKRRTIKISITKRRKMYSLLFIFF